MRSLFIIAAYIIGGLAAVWAGMSLCIAAPLFGYALFFVVFLVGFVVLAFGMGAFFLGVYRIWSRILAHIPELQQ